MVNFPLLYYRPVLRDMIWDLFEAGAIAGNGVQHREF